MAWLSGLSDEQHDKLVPIVQPRQTASKAMLGPFIESQLEARKSDLKASSTTVYSHTKANLIAFFGKSRDIATITSQDARDFRKWLEEKANRKQTGVAMADNTVRKRTGVARGLFDRAIEEGLITRNPFAKLPVTVRPNEAREFYLSLEQFQILLSKVVDSEWRLLLMLARLEAFRIPSEAAVLRWDHVDFDKRQIYVMSPKTDRTKPLRIAPLLPEVAEQFKSIERTGDRVFPWLEQDTNLRSQLLKFIKRAGLEQWPKLWQNLRTSAATDFARVCPAHVAAKICGHTVQVARAFYWQVTDSDISEAREKLGGLTGGLKKLQRPATRAKTKTADKPGKKQRKPRKS